MIFKSILFNLAKKTVSERYPLEKVDPYNKRTRQNIIDRYKFASNYCRDKNVLDIACGKGIGTLILAQKAKKCVGVDYSNSFRAFENKTIGKRNVIFVQSEALEFLKSNKEKFDTIVSYETVEHIKKHKEFLKLLYRNLQTGGVLLLSTPNKKLNDYLYGGVYNPWHVKEFYKEEMQCILFDVFKNSLKFFSKDLSKKRTNYYPL